MIPRTTSMRVALSVINPADKEKGAMTKARPAYHAGLAVKAGAAGFRGINGRLPAKTRVPSIYSTDPAAPTLTAARDVMPTTRAIPPQGRSAMATFTPHFPDVHVQLTGHDGNVFAIIGRVRSALRKSGASQEQVDDFTKEVTSAGSYDDALAIVMRWVNVS